MLREGEETSKLEMRFKSETDDIPRLFAHTERYPTFYIEADNQDFDVQFCVIRQRRDIVASELDCWVQIYIYIYELTRERRDMRQIHYSFG